MILLCSNGISSDSLLKCLQEKHFSGKAALVVTADNEYKDKNWHVPRVREELQLLGFEVKIFDIDNQPASRLLEYDAVEFIGETHTI